MNFETTEIKTISLNTKNNQTLSIQTQGGGSPNNYLNGNQYQNSNDKDLFEWTQQSMASQFENNRYNEKDEECISRA